MSLSGLKSYFESISMLNLRTNLDFTFIEK